MNKKLGTISRERFADAFIRIGWKKSDAESGNYDIWTSPINYNIWTVVPRDESTEEYTYYQDKNIKIILDALNLRDNEFNISDIYSQLQGYNYKLINRIVQDNDYDDIVVPFELADVLSNSTIDAFRFFYKMKNHGKQVPIENFQLHHTQKGSFLIPISISAELEDGKLFDLPSSTNLILHDYLKTVETLVKIPQKDEKDFADRVIDENIDSKIVRTFLGNQNSIAKVKTKYRERVSELGITSNGSPILDFGLSEKDKTFPEVDITGMESLPETYLEVLESREIEADSSTIDASGVKIDVEVDSLDQNGTVKFSVFSINQKGMNYPFKARSVKLTKKTLDYLTDAFKSREIIEVTGDITKAKGKVGEIIADNFSTKGKNPTLFELTE